MPNLQTSNDPTDIASQDGSGEENCHNYYDEPH